MLKILIAVISIGLSLNAADPWINIILYHRVLVKTEAAYDVSVEDFENQMEYLKASYDIISLSDALDYITRAKELKNNSVVITFDDGDVSIYNNAFPILKKYRFPFSVFIYTNIVKEGPHAMKWNHMKQMLAYGAEIGSHSVSHGYLNKRLKEESEEQYLARLRHELVDSKNLLEAEFGLPVRYFAYPYGRYNETVKEEANKAGYEAILTVRGYENFPGDDPMRLNRRVVQRSTTPESFIKTFTVQQRKSLNDGDKDF